MKYVAMFIRMLAMLNEWFLHK